VTLDERAGSEALHHARLPRAAVADQHDLEQVVEAIVVARAHHQIVGVAARHPRRVPRAHGDDDDDDGDDDRDGRTSGYFADTASIWSLDPLPRRCRRRRRLLELRLIASILFHLSARLRIRISDESRTSAAATLLLLNFCSRRIRESPLKYEYFRKIFSARALEGLRQSPSWICFRWFYSSSTDLIKNWSKRDSRNDFFFFERVEGDINTWDFALIALTSSTGFSFVTWK